MVGKIVYFCIIFCSFHFPTNCTTDNDLDRSEKQRQNGTGESCVAGHNPQQGSSREESRPVVGDSSLLAVCHLHCRHSISQTKVAIFFHTNLQFNISIFLF